MVWFHSQRAKYDSGEDSDYSDKDEELPQVVVVSNGDLTADEAEREKQRLDRGMYYQLNSTLSVKNTLTYLWYFVLMHTKHGNILCILDYREQHQAGRSDRTHRIQGKGQIKIQRRPIRE